jgi:uncharacterized protein YecE (DUF72 family)
MKFGKLADISQVDFRLKEIPDSTKEVLKRAKNQRSQIYWGCTGWAMKEWIGKFYPTGAKQKDFLQHYSKQFNTIELNTTHYRIPDQHTIEKWYQESTPEFKFSPKIPQIISHSGDLGLGQVYTDQFCKSIVGLQEKLGCSFMQLPPHFSPEKLHLLTLFLQKFPTKEIPLAIEVRHPMWYEPNHFEALIELLEKYAVNTVITDVAGRRDVLHLALTTPLAMLRFVGNGLHSTDYQRIDDWIAVFQQWLNNGLEELYFFSHQPDNILSPEMCVYFTNKLEERTGIKLEKKTKAIEDGQMTLF